MKNTWNLIWILMTFVITVITIYQLLSYQKEKIEFDRIQDLIIAQKIRVFNEGSSSELLKLKKLLKQFNGYELNDGLLKNINDLIYPKLPGNPDSINNLLCKVDSLKQICINYNSYLSNFEFPYSDTVKNEFPLFYALGLIKHLSKYFTTHDPENWFSDSKLVAVHDTTQKLLRVIHFRKFKSLDVEMSINQISYPVDSFGLIAYKNIFSKKGIYPLAINCHLKNPVNRNIVNRLDTFNIEIR